MFGFEEAEMRRNGNSMIEGGLKELQRVCFLILLSYRTRKGPSTEFHVHVGNRARDFRLERLQDVTAIHFLIDPGCLLLGKLPKKRRFARVCEVAHVLPFEWCRETQFERLTR
jgi:hypothetical protein